MVSSTLPNVGVEYFRDGDLGSVFALEEHAIELRLDLCDTLELQLKLLECPLELMSQLHDFLNLLLIQVSDRAAFASRSNWARGSSGATWSRRAARSTTPSRTAASCRSLRAGWSWRTCGPAPARRTGCDLVTLPGSVTSHVEAALYTVETQTSDDSHEDALAGVLAFSSYPRARHARVGPPRTARRLRISEGEPRGRSRHAGPSARGRRRRDLRRRTSTDLTGHEQPAEADRR